MAKAKLTSFLANSITIQFPETHGRKFVNASNSEYLLFIKHPILIYKADDNAELIRAWNRAKERGLHIGIYADPLFATKNEDENHIEIAKHTDSSQALVGIAIDVESKKGSKAIDGLSSIPEIVQ